MSNLTTSQLFRVIYSTRQGADLDFLCSYKVSTVHNVSNRAYFCEVCGETWARRIYEVLPTNLYVSQDLYSKRAWGIQNEKCPLHGGGNLLTGTEHLESLPRELMMNALENWK
jgi:hypothetical protein